MNPNILKKVAAKGAEIGIAVGIGHALGRSSEQKIVEQEKLLHQEITQKLDNIQNSVQDVKDIVKNNPLSDAATNKNKFISDFNIDSFYSYLDSLTLSQELALIHILFFILYFIIAFEIFSIFFGNEIINYFDLENKYPKLKTFFKLRATYQRYYIIWCLIKLFIICSIGIIFNLLIFI